MSAEIDGPSKGLLGAFAAFTLGSGIATLGYGILLLHRYLGVTYNYGDFNLFMASTILIGVGSLLLITLLLGVFGALKDVSNLRLVTLVLLFLVFAILAIVGVYAMVSCKTDRLQKSIENEFKSMSTDYNNLSTEFKKKANDLHQQHKCCSLSTNNDPMANAGGNSENCCILPHCAADVDGKKYFEKSCNNVYFETKAQAVFHIAILALIAAGVVLFALVLYAGLSQRARAGYAVVSHGQMK